MLTVLRHLAGSTRYSLQGLGVLLKERSARIEVFGGLAGLAALIILGASLGHCIIFAVLVLILLAVEALNTAIEEIINRLSPERSDFARDAKDLGSAAVFCIVCAIGVYLAAVLLGLAGIVDF